MDSLSHTDLKFPKQDAKYVGKVRDVYSIDDKYLAMVVTDRISAFDVVLPKGIPYKGQVLNQIASLFLDRTKDIIPNWKIADADPMLQSEMKFRRSGRHGGFINIATKDVVLKPDYSIE